MPESRKVNLRHPVLPLDFISPPPGYKPSVSPHDDEVMASPRLIVIWWGDEYWTNGPPTTVQQTMAFLNSILPSPYFGMLAEYNVGTATILQTLAIGYQGGPQTLSEGDISNLLQTWMLNALILPPADNETEQLYVLFVPSAVILTVGGVSQNDPKGGFIGYHDHGKYNKLLGKDNLFYAVICGGLDFTQLTHSASHELAEAFTDRSGNGWYDDNTGFEIGDICDCGVCPTLTLNGFTLASYWRQSQDMCMQQTDLTPGEQTVPEVVGLDPQTAQQILSAGGLVMTVTQTTPTTAVTSPTVTSQAPAAGTLVAVNTVVSVTVATPTQTIVPNVRGMDPTHALHRLQQNNLFMDVTATDYSPNVDSARVIEQNPSPGLSVNTGTYVGVIVEAPKNDNR